MPAKPKVSVEIQDSGRVVARSGWIALAGFLFLRIDLLAVLSSLLFASVIAFRLLARASLRGMSIRISTSQARTRSGEPVKATVVFSNRNRLLPLFYPVISIRESDTIRVQVYQYPGIVPARSSKTLIVDPSMTQRGKRHFEAFAPRSRFPFALYEATARIARESEALIVWPRPEPIDLEGLFNEPPRFRYENAGDHLTLLNTTDAARIRDYFPGDPLSRISWKLSAKRDKLTIIEPRDEPQERFELHLDTSSELWQSDLRFERMLRLVSSLVSELSRHKLAQAITIDRTRYPLATHRESLRFFDALALLHPSPKEPSIEPRKRRHHLWILPAPETGIYLAAGQPETAIPATGKS